MLNSNSVQTAASRTTHIVNRNLPKTWHMKPICHIVGYILSKQYQRVVSNFYLLSLLRPS